MAWSSTADDILAQVELHEEAVWPKWNSACAHSTNALARAAGKAAWTCHGFASAMSQACMNRPREAHAPVSLFWPSNTTLRNVNLAKLAGMDPALLPMGS